eukprot:m.16599 g.16599  ORF g.16599 m.16599 type:complete len:84 (+) comp27030_c0_seq1:329-580(+)
MGYSNGRSKQASLLISNAFSWLRNDLSYTTIISLIVVKHCQCHLPEYKLPWFDLSKAKSLASLSKRLQNQESTIWADVRCPER